MTDKFSDIANNTQKVGAIGKFQFMEGSWDKFVPKDPFHFIEEFQHALAICLNAVYANQVTVKAFENPQVDGVMFGAQVHGAVVKWMCTIEGLHNEIGYVFEEVLHGMCDQIDKSGVIVEHKPTPWNINPCDSIDPMDFLPKTTPVTGSYKKLHEPGVTRALAKAMNDGASIKHVSVSDIHWAFNKFNKALDEFEKKFKNLEDSAKKTQVAILDFEKKFADGGWIPADGTVVTSGYGDSGTKLKQICPALKELVTSPCACGHGTDYLENVIIHLNDSPGHGILKTDKPAWTREEIADWLETLDVDIEFKENK